MNHQVDQKVLNDFYDFFSGKYTDMLPYVYAEPSDAYKRIVKNCKDYYLFGDEIDNIEHNKDKFINHLANVEDIIEIGPGFDFILTKKTLPVISYAKQLKRYFAVDKSANYLEEACEFLKNNTSSIEILPLEADLLSDKGFQLFNPVESEKSQKCVILFGVTLGNFTDEQRICALKNLHDATEVGDLVILTVDTNIDGESVKKAYTGEEFSDFGRCALWHFAKINPEFHDHVMSFDLIYKWNEQEKSLQRFYVAKKPIKFQFGKYGEINIKKGQELSGYKTRKSVVNDILNLLEKYFTIEDILSYSGRVKTFVCKKM